MRCLTLLLMAGLIGGCLAPLPYSADDNLVSQLGPDEAHKRLAAVMRRASQPRIADVEVTPVMLKYRHTGLDPWGVPNLNQNTQIRWVNFGRVDVYENNKVFIYDTSNRERTWVLFASPEDALEFVDLMYSFKRSHQDLPKTSAAPKPKGELPLPK